MPNPLTLIAPIAAVGGLFVVAPVVADTYRRFNGPKLVRCPEIDAPAEIELDAARAAGASAFGATDLRVTRCTRWPNRHYCGKECLVQLA